jgi:hypothetical protein
LNDGSYLTAKEFCGWMRIALSTAADWRSQHKERGPPYELVAGMVRYRVGNIRRWLSSDRLKRRRGKSAPSSGSPPGSASPAAATQRGGETVRK